MNFPVSIQIRPDRFVQKFFLILVALMLAGCASTGVVQYGIVPEVIGKKSISEIEVAYGKEIIRFKGPLHPLARSVWNAPMPIPESMTIKWTVDGQRLQTTVPMKGKLSSRPLENWRIRFTDESVELWREDLTAPPSTPTGLRSRELVKVYP